MFNNKFICDTNVLLNISEFYYTENKLMLQEQVIEEIKAIPYEKLIDVYNLIHQFRINLSILQPKKFKTVDEVFGKLYKKEQKTISIEEMNAAIKLKMKAKFQ